MFMGEEMHHITHGLAHGLADIFAIRHGETEYARERRYAGARDVPLSPRGLRQCEALGRSLPGAFATGTPDGVGAGRTPQEWLWPGDVVEAEVAGIGRLRHPVVAV